MTEERITRVEAAGQPTQTHTTVITDQPRRSSAAPWLIALVLVVLAVLAFMLLSPMSGAEVAKDNAVADAASSVGAAADSVGDAAQDAAQSLK